MLRSGNLNRHNRIVEQRFRHRGGTSAAHGSRREQESRPSHAHARFGGGGGLFRVSALWTGRHTGDRYSLGPRRCRRRCRACMVAAEQGRLGGLRFFFYISMPPPYHIGNRWFGGMPPPAGYRAGGMVGRNLLRSLVTDRGGRHDPGGRPALHAGDQGPRHLRRRLTLRLRQKGTGGPQGPPVSFCGLARLR